MERSKRWYIVAALLALSSLQTWSPGPHDADSAALAAISPPRSQERRRVSGLNPAAVFVRRGEIERKRKIARPAFGITNVKQVLHFGRYPQMWWERIIGPANLSRADLRLSGWDTYAIVASVLLQVILGLYGSIPVPYEKADRRAKLVFEAQLGLLTVASLCSIFTMMIFLLNKIYCATALGMWKDVSYEVFRQKSSAMRVRAFSSLSIALGCFLLAFIVNLLDNLKVRVNNRRLLIIGAIITVVVCCMVWKVYDMMRLANELVFH